MKPRTAPVAAAAAAALLATALAGCAAQTPEERVAALRAEYIVKLQGVQVVEQPVEGPAPVPVEEAGAGPPAADAVSGEAIAGQAEQLGAGETAPPPEVRRDVILDILVDNRSDERLPGLTLDVEQVDAQGQPKTSYRIWVDTSEIAPGTRRAVSHRLEDVDATAADGFHLEVRQAIRPEEREQYREFSEIDEQP
jgi:hypothetical protein